MGRHDVGERTCQRCGDTFPGAPNAKWCEDKCRAAAYRQRRRNRVSELEQALDDAHAGLVAARADLDALRALNRTKGGTTPAQVDKTLTAVMDTLRRAAQDAAFWRLPSRKRPSAP